MKERNPFVTQGYLDPQHFCDREAETRALIADIENGRHVTLMAPRRYGKSGLIRHALHTHAKEYAFVYVDLLSTTNLSDFVRILANAVLGTLDTRLGKAIAAFSSFFRSVRPNVKATPGGDVSFSFEMAEAAPSTTLDQIFDYLSKKSDCELVIALDEFQQVAKYPEKGTEAQLRSRIQFLPPNIHFIFAGSQMHLLGEMFSSPRRPFYQSTTFLPLDVIPVDKYSVFAERFYRKAKRVFDTELFGELHRRFDGITWYVQATLNELWAMGDGLSDASQLEVAVANLVARRRLTFYDLDVSQSASARQLLRAVAHAGIVAEPTSAEFLSSSGLHAPSTVAGALKQLLSNELLYKTDAGYVIYDRLFGEYLKGCSNG